MHNFSDGTHMFLWNVHDVMTTFDFVYLEMTSTPRRALFAWRVTIISRSICRKHFGCFPHNWKTIYLHKYMEKAEEINVCSSISPVMSYTILCLKRISSSALLWVKNEHSYCCFMALTKNWEWKAFKKGQIDRLARYKTQCSVLAQSTFHCSKRKWRHKNANCFFLLLF